MKQIAWIILSWLAFLAIAQAASNNLPSVSSEGNNKNITQSTRKEMNNALVGSWKWNTDRIQFGSDGLGTYYRNNTICFKFSFGLSTANMNDGMVDLIGGVVYKQRDCDFKTITAITGDSFGSVFSYEYSIADNILFMKSHQYSFANKILSIKSTGIESKWEKVSDIVNTASPLCNKQESVIFSCSIANSKTLSICSAPNSTSDLAPITQYRFGTNGKAPELIYPKHPKRTEDAFTFSSQKNSTGFPLEIISFSIGSIKYDVISPDKASFRWAPFVGVEVTLPNKPPQLLECDDNVVVDFQPIKKLLHVSEDSAFLDALPKVKVDESAFPITRNVTTDSHGAETTVSYPTINDSNIDNEISKFIGGCDWEDYSHAKGSKCNNTVSASIIKGEYLVIHFDGYMYAAGTPHGYGNQHTKIYHKIGQAWQQIKGSDFFVNSDDCHSKIISIIYRHLKPLRLNLLDSTKPLDLINEADIYPTAQGMEFAYQPYQFGSYAQTPWPTLVPWNSLNNCLRSQ